MLNGTCGDCRTGRVDETGVVVFWAVGARDAASAAQLFGFSVGEIKHKRKFFFKIYSQSFYLPKEGRGKVC